MARLFYSIFNNHDELLFANTTPYGTVTDAQKAIEELHNKIVHKHNIEITQYTKDSLKFIDKPMTEFEENEIHIFQIMKGSD